MRKELAGISPAQPAPAAYGEGLYTAERTDAPYAQLLHRAGELLIRGESVVLDASWTRARHRAAAEDLARRTHSDLVHLECRATDSPPHARTVPTASDATAAIARAMAAAADPWPDAVAVCTRELANRCTEAASMAGAPLAATQTHDSAIEVRDVAFGRCSPCWARPPTTRSPGFGRKLSAVLLTATTLGLAACPLSQPLEIGATRRTLRDDVLAGTLCPQIVLRLGWSPVGPPLPATPRRSFADIATVEHDY